MKDIIKKFKIIIITFIPSLLINSGIGVLNSSIHPKNSINIVTALPAVSFAVEAVCFPFAPDDRNRS